MASVNAGTMNFKKVAILLVIAILAGFAVWYFLIRSKEYPGVPRIAVKYYKEGLDSLDAGRIEAAANLFTKAVDMDHSFADACAKLAETFYRASVQHKTNKNSKMQTAMLDQAKRFMLMAFDAQPTNGNAHFVRGLIAYDHMAYDDAIRDFEHAEMYGFKSFELHSMMAYLYNEKEMTALCLEQFQKALTIKNNDVKTLINLGEIYFQIGNYEKASDYYSALLKIDPKQTKARVIYALCIWKNGNENQGKSMINQILEDEDTPKVNTYNLAAWQLIDKDIDIAWGIKLANAANDMKPNNIESIDILGWGYYKSGDYSKAVEYLSQSMKKMPSDEVKNRLKMAKDKLEESKK